ncbi:MAG: SMP-30/gluconolactonase/LRE family protein [Proteobacteria bacterium]|nr:SMP-30/gluconolactonase/LRE family protein [Pseudomonadota bacterium]
MPNTVVAEGLGFPEGPAIDRQGNLYVTEIAGGQISRVAADGTLSVFARTGGGPNGSNFGPDGNLYVCNNGGFPGSGRTQGRVERVTADGEVSVLITEIDGQPLASPNDLGFDEHGGFYFTDPVWGSDPLASSPPGHVCYSDLQGNARRLHTGLLFPNGIGVSLDGGTLIVCESLTCKLHAFDILEPGALSEPREFADLGKGAIPDGFAFDADGNLLCCGHQSGRIHVFGPEGGSLQAALEFEDPDLTNVCFGGAEFKTLFVTESGKGRVVKLDWERPGMVLFPDR